MIRLLFLSLFVATAIAQTWHPQTSTTTESLRGVSAVNRNVAWASGARGTILKTTDGGKTWRQTGMTGVSDLDFRDIEAIDARAAQSLRRLPTVAQPPHLMPCLEFQKLMQSQKPLASLLVDCNAQEVPLLVVL